MADDSESSSVFSQSGGCMVDDGLTDTRTPSSPGSTTPGHGAQANNGFPPPCRPTLEQGNINARAYQLEMLAESRKKNVILAMDTGSGKTQVAVLRIRAELEEGATEKMVWFMAPTVALCSQQYLVLQSQIPAVQIKLLRGSDNIDSWSDQETWDAVLLNVRIVVSTPQILYDALSHGFVQMESFSLLVFDEAHNSVRRSAGRMIMKNFYHDRKNMGLHVPHIMGLTASPIMRSKLEGLEALEHTLDAVCVTPTLHREDLSTYVKRPRLSYALYEPANLSDLPTSILSLRAAFQSMEITKDPYVLHLRDTGTDRARRALINVLRDHDTFSQQQMKSFFDQSVRVLEDLGFWAAEHYIWKVVTTFLTAFDAKDLSMNNWRDEEKHYLAGILRQVDVSEPPVDTLSTDNTSDKVTVLMQNLTSGDEGAVGVVFVKERSTAAILAHLVASHPLTQQRYPSTGVVVGTSNHVSKKKNMWDLSLESQETEPLQQFRSGELSLLFATNVLEEGIDVPACNLVICFDEPENLKSFIQRRGRARKKDSRLLILLSRSNPVPRDWEDMESEMKEHYEDQQRELQRIQEIEESESVETEYYVVANTNARLDYENAKSHLDHFCSELSPGEFIDTRPDYIPRVVDDEDPPSLRVTVLLPSYVPVAVRHAESRNTWKSEKNASKDAAFQAYLGLYKAGLINDHMLPFTLEDFLPKAERRMAVLQVNGLLNTWVGVARAWKSSTEMWETLVTLKDTEGSIKGSYRMRAPVQLSALPEAPVYIDRKGPWLLEFGPQGRTKKTAIPDHTSALLALPFKHRWPADSRQQVITFVSVSQDISLDHLGARQVADMDVAHSELPYLIRDVSGCPYIFDRLLANKPPIELVQRAFRPFGETPGFWDAPSDVPYLALKRWSRRTDFLHPQNVGAHAHELTSSKPYARVYPVEWAKIDTVPLDHAYFGALIPSILHHIEVRLVAEQLSSSLLRNLDLSDPSLVLTAISTKAAAEATDYERVELLGDSILKLCTTLNVAALHPDWPEGYLSRQKDGLVSNSRLHRATLDSGLDKFILTESFTGRKWRPMYVDDLLEKGPIDSGPRFMSSKTLADIVEALIGTAYVDGGLPKAIACIALFLKELDWKPLATCQVILKSLAPPDVALPPMLMPLEQLIGYTFSTKSLLIEAVTHASFTVGHVSGCLERLEFLGDAILDNVVVSYLFPLNLSQDRMHLLKTASVNGEFLGFLALEHHVEEEEVLITANSCTSASDSDSDIGSPGHGKGKKIAPNLKRTMRKVPFWKFMRHSSTEVASEQAKAVRNHADLREPIIHALEHGSNYPWALLARLRARKFFSDMVEAVIGAVWVDSGDMDACTRVAERLGIMTVLERLVKENVHVLHPKQELGQLASDQTVEYNVTAPEAGSGGRDVRGWYTCKVMIGERCVVEIGDGISRDEAETKAAEKAVSILKDEVESERESNSQDNGALISVDEEGVMQL